MALVKTSKLTPKAAAKPVRAAAPAPAPAPAAPASQAAKVAGRVAAATEELAAAFHDGRAGFLQIADTVGEVLDEWLRDRHDTVGNPGTVEIVEQADGWARERARELTTSTPRSRPTNGAWR